jgi:hypothetical protein
MPIKQGSRGRPSHATIVAYLALFVALGGTAGALAGKNTVDSRDIKPKSVKASDLAANAVVPAKIRSNAVTGAKVLDDTLGRADLGTDSVSPAELDLFRSSTNPGTVALTGPSGQSLGAAVTLEVPAGGLIVFYAEADIQVNGALGASECRMHARTGSSDVFLLQIDPGSGNPPQPFRSELVPAVFPAGTYTFTLTGSVNGVTTNTCTYVAPDLRAFVLG